MANEMDVRFTGTITRDVEIRTVGDKRVLGVGLAHSARVKRGDEHVDSETMWLDGSLWERWPGDRRVDNVLASLGKGARVEVVGKLRLEAYEGRNGSGVSNRLQIESIAPCLEWATAQPVKNERGGARPAGGGWDAPQPQQSWGQPAGSPQGGSWGQPQQQAQSGAPQQSAPAQQQTAAPGASAQQSTQASWGGFEDEQPF